MISGQYGQAWEIYEALQREHAKDPERVRATQPIVYFALQERDPEIKALQAKVDQAQARKAEVESQLSEQVAALALQLADEIALAAELQRRADEQEARANELDSVIKGELYTGASSFDEGEQQHLARLGWSKSVKRTQNAELALAAFGIDLRSILTDCERQPCEIPPRIWERLQTLARHACR